MNKELAIECIKTQRQFVDDMTREAFDMAIDLIKGNVAPVVRCKDCVHCEKETMLCTIFMANRMPTDYCSCGERKDND